jgi:cycloeucalenol cycloisomerase
MGWFSERPDKAWGERYFLATSPIWMASVVFLVLSGAMRRWTEWGYLAYGLLAAAPAVVGPLLTKRGRSFDVGVPYWVKLNLFAAVLVFFGTYFGTHYFFDLMGMRYAFPSKWTFEAIHVGKTGGVVPSFLYPLTQAYFVTYFTVLVVAYRKIVTTLRLGALGRAAVVLVLAYAIAFAETFFMATDLMTDLFSYEKRDKMLTVGSLGYATYFVFGLPLARQIDEDAPTPLGRVLEMALAASMATLILLEGWSRLVGRL